MAVFGPAAFDSETCEAYACPNEATGGDYLCSHCRRERSLMVRRERHRVELPPRALWYTSRRERSLKIAFEYPVKNTA